MEASGKEDNEQALCILGSGYDAMTCGQEHDVVEQDKAQVEN